MGRLFKQKYVTNTQEFFERHGGKAVTLAQFVPIIRTFTPVMAGVGKMHYRHFAIFNLIGAFFWAFWHHPARFLAGQLHLGARKY